jgi:hypothetical protein
MNTSRKRKGDHWRQLLTLIFSLPFLSISGKPSARIIDGRGAAEDSDLWRQVQSTIQSDPQTLSLFVQTAISLGIQPPAETDAWVEDMDGTTGMPILRRMVTKLSQSSGRDKADAAD